MDSYDDERIHGADENIMNSTRSTDFITPKSDISRVFRNAVLDLSEHHAFARPLVNSGRLSMPCNYVGHSLTGEDALEGGPARSQPGMPCLMRLWTMVTCCPNWVGIYPDGAEHGCAIAPRD